MEDFNSGDYSIVQYFDQSVFNEIVEAKRGRQREELNLDFKLFAQKINFLLEDGGDKEDAPAEKARDGIGRCVGYSRELAQSNEEETHLLTDLEELVEDILFRFETIHHVRNSPVNVDEDEVSEEDEYEEEYAQKEIATLFEDCNNFKIKTTGKIIKCSASLNKLKSEISELLNNNPRARRQSRNFGMLGKLMDSKNMSAVHSKMRQASFSPHESTIVEEELNTAQEFGPVVESIHKFIKEQELPDDETMLISTKVNILAKTVDHFKTELRAANLKTTEDQIKINNLQTRIPKIEESRERLSLKCEEVKDELFEKKTEVAKLKLKIGSLEKAAHELESAPPPAHPNIKPEEEQETPASAKQAIIPKSVLKDVLHASDEELERKLAELASSNEAVKVVLVRKNKQIRQLDATIIRLNTETSTLKKRISDLDESIPEVTVDGEALKTEEAVNDEVVSPATTPEGLERRDVASPGSLFATTESCITTSVSCTYGMKAFVNAAVNTDLQLEDIGTQTEEDAPPTQEEMTDVLEQITFKIDRRRRKTRKMSMMPCPSPMSGRRRTSVSMAGSNWSGDSSRRNSSVMNQDLFGIASPTHVLTNADLATIQEFNKKNGLNDKTIKQADDVAILQKYIASMREQTEKSMEKIREFIAKEKSRTDATTRRLINEHEKILSQHKKEMNKVTYSICRFKEMITELLNGREITQVVLQTNFKFEQSPIQMRVQSMEMLSSMEYAIFQALKEKDLKIRDLSGRKRLDDKDIDRRIKEREKTVFSILDYTNERLRKEQERVTMREQWVNKRIKTDMEFERQQEQETRAVEVALQRFWQQHGDTLQTEHVVGPDSSNETTSRTHSARTHSADTTPTQSTFETDQPSTKQDKKPLRESPKPLPESLISLEAIIPRLYISVPDQRKNIEYLDVAHRAGALTNLGHKLITNIIARWLQLTEKKIRVLFAAYIKYRRWTTLMNELMQLDAESQDEGQIGMERAMALHRRIRDGLDMRYKQLHVELGKLNSFRGNMLEEEEGFFAGVPDTRALKNIVRPNMLQINNNYGMLRKLMEGSMGRGRRELHVMFPHVSDDQSTHYASTAISLENLPVVKHIQNTHKHVTHWKTNVTIEKDTEIKSLLVPKIMELDTNRTIPIRLQKGPTQRPPVRQYSNASGLPPIPLYGTKMKFDRISYIPNVASMWSSQETSPTSE